MAGSGKRALLIVDVQNGFCADGNLPVPGGDEVVPVINRLMAEGDYDLIVASQDWHPPHHKSFASQHPGKKPFDMGSLRGKPQVMWPDHCVQGTRDAELHPELDTERIHFVQRKGEDSEVDSYSAFRDNHAERLTGLHRALIERGISELDICGLATDYCVKFSALDAAALLPGVKVRVIENASRGITPEGVAAALAEMQQAGVEVVRL
ncbi:MAG TPA: bifunctional nicotinamidase/pyrazinamidase [Aestuariivirgaceae bacterium]|jgi:nicotinamidase/pyrazinamidase|nr:bifunctional nicotinamidase/pyrazinamidase [Aestuariivirgaceae bacterium]